MSDVSSVTNHFPTANEGFITTLGSTILAGATTVPLTTVSGLTNGTIFVGIIEPGGAKQQTFTGTVDTSGVQITGVKWTRGTNVDHSAGVTIVDYVSGTGNNMFTKGILVDHSQAGAHEIATNYDPANPTLETQKWVGVSSAVNEITVTNAATGNGPSITATGGDTNINLLVSGKGTGLEIPKGAYPQGFLVNGKISRTVASNNITVSILTLDGNTPSATNPVYCRIGNTVRSITSALSVTRNAGTNWFNSGSAELGATAMDYFVYLGYNSTDGVVIGFARFPFARIYSDFSTTTTNANYGAISTTTSAVSTDEYENIGRFNAILGVSASYNWSIPGADLVVNRPIFFTRLMTFVSQLGGTGAAIGNGTMSSFHKISDDYIDVSITITAGSTTTWSSSGTTVSLPFPAHGTYYPDRMILGNLEYYDTSVPAAYSGFAQIATSGTVVSLNVHGAAGTYTSPSTISSTGPVPVAIGTGDVIRLNARYKYLA